MKKYVMLFSCTLLSACQLGDPVPQELPASASIAGNDVCVKVAPEGDETVRSIFIYQDNDVQHGTVKEFYPQLHVTRDQCLPTIGYQWESGKRYTWHINMASQQKIDKGVYPTNRGFVVSFRYVEENDQKQLMAVDR